MPWEINASSWLRQLTSPILDGNTPLALRPVVSSAISMNLALSTAGRLGFFIDYSELSDSGTHTFYVARTHGSVGEVSATYSTGGDTHTATTGTMTWADGEMDVKAFTVDVSANDLTTHQTTNGLGEHRIWALLSNPTNSAVLHSGTEHTRAYGVIDNNVLASDANAVFYDADAVTNGTGTQASPYNSVYDAIANIGSKRYLYGKGATIPDGTDTYLLTNVIQAPATRTGEADRLYIRNWSGSAWNVTASVSNTESGFFTQAGESYHTYNGIDFSGLDCSSANTQVFGVHYRYNDSAGINMENCSCVDMNGNVGNHALFLPWGVDGFKMWNCSADNVQEQGDNQDFNTSMFNTYLAKNGSVQRCTAKNSYIGVYHKQTALGDVSTTVRFCDLTEGLSIGIEYGEAGSADASHSFTIAQCNIVKGATQSGVRHNDGFNNASLGAKHWWCNNVFDECGTGAVSAIHFKEAFSAQIFNNIMINCRQVWSNNADDTGLKTPDIEYADYQCAFGTTSPVQDYIYRGTGYATATALNAAFPAFEGNTTETDPLFVDSDNGDYSLQITSPELTSGVDGTQKGAYIGNFYTIGAN